MCYEFKCVPHFSGFFQSHRACTLRQKAKQNTLCLYLLIQVEKNHLIFKSKGLFSQQQNLEPELPRLVAFKPLDLSHLPCGSRIYSKSYRKPKRKVTRHFHPTHQGSYLNLPEFLLTQASSATSAFHIELLSKILLE